MTRLFRHAYKALYVTWTYFVAAMRSLNAALTGNEEDLEQLGGAIESSGFEYDPEQGIFYSALNAWQRKFGYCQLYDIMAAPMGMIMDCEPIYFEYDGRNWLIEFWKGQYGLSTGCEAGVYYTDAPVTSIPGFFNTTLYNSVSDEDLLYISLKLKKNNRTLFKRSGRHWWMTGFIPGEFSQPDELKMIIKISFTTKQMCRAFYKALCKAGYTRHDAVVKDKSVCLVFDKPKTCQPFTRTKITDWLIQEKNKFLCDSYNEIGLPVGKLMEKLGESKGKDSVVYRKTLSMFRSRKAYQRLWKLNDRLTRH